MEKANNHTGNPQSYNRYSYVLNNPLKYTDPSGYNFIDDLGWGIEKFLTFITIPGRIYGGAVTWFNDWANHSLDPNGGYFSAEYILNGVLPAPSFGFFGMFEPGSGSGMMEARGNGFAAADGSFYSNGDLADEAWAIYAVNHQAREQGDFNNMDVLAALDMQTRINNMIANAASGLMYAGPGLTDPPDKNGDGTVEEKKGKAGEGDKMNGIVTAGFTGTLSAGFLGGSFEIGIAFDGKDYSLYVTLEHAVGADLSAGGIVNYHAPHNGNLSFSEAEGWSESYNVAAWIFDGTYGYFNSCC